MEETRTGMEVDLDAEVPLFLHLAELCVRVEERDRHLRLVGGAAMLLWGRYLSQPRDMTEDIDCALLRADLPNSKTAEKLAREVVDDLRDLGFTRPEDWRASRKARFSYPHSTDEVAVEFLCGDISVGEASRREPAWKIASVPDGPPHFYAAKVPWLDFVDDWIPVHTTCGEHAFTLRVPDLSGLAILKLRAIVDKIQRLGEEEDPEVTELEKLRLKRHARDCILLFDWIDERGEFDRLVQLAAKYGIIRSAAREGARWVLTNEALVKELELGGLGQSLERLVPVEA